MAPNKLSDDFSKLLLAPACRVSRPPPSLQAAARYFRLGAADSAQAAATGAVLRQAALPAASAHRAVPRAAGLRAQTSARGRPAAVAHANRWLRDGAERSGNTWLAAPMTLWLLSWWSALGLSPADLLTRYVHVLRANKRRTLPRLIFMAKRNLLCEVRGIQYLVEPDAAWRRRLCGMQPNRWREWEEFLADLLKDPGWVELEQQQAAFLRSMNAQARRRRRQGGS